MSRRGLEVDVLGESYLFRACEEEVITVNSFHHQAVDRVAPTLNVIARCSTDQIVEAVQRRFKPMAMIFWLLFNGTRSVSIRDGRKICA